MIDELVRTVRAHLSERLTSPLMGAFLVSWCAWNYRTIFVLLSGEKVFFKFAAIDTVLFPDTETVLLRGLLFPLLTACGYLFLYPFPAKWVYQFARQRQREILEIRRKIEDETPLTVEDSKRLRNELVKAENAYFSELDRKEAEIEKLRAQLAQLQVPSAGAAAALEIEESPERSERLPPELIRMLRLIDEHDGKILETAAIAKSGLPRIEAEYALGELRQRNLASRIHEPRANGYVFKFTHQGRAALLASRASAEA